jgi:hypothetical protein
VKTFRLWLLVLVAVLLPLRGAIAAGLPCAGGSPAPQPQGVAMAQHHHHATGGAHHLHAAAAAGLHDHGAAGHADKCNLCAACCSGGALPTDIALRVAAAETGTEAFPEPASPAPSFVAEGQERPPRSL